MSAPRVPASWPRLWKLTHLTSLAFPGLAIYMSDTTVSYVVDICIQLFHVRQTRPEHSASCIPIFVRHHTVRITATQNLNHDRYAMEPHCNVYIHKFRDRIPNPSLLSVDWLRYLFILVQDESWGIAPAQRMLGAVQHRLEPIRSLTVDSPHDVRMLYTAYR